MGNTTRSGLATHDSTPASLCTRRSCRQRSMSSMSIHRRTAIRETRLSTWSCGALRKGRVGTGGVDDMDFNVWLHCR